MPIENEYKLVLRLSSLDDIMFNVPTQAYIEQGYLTSDGSVRVRHSKCLYSDYFLTYKRMVDNRLIEIETKISPEDFAPLWSVATNKLKKKRFSFHNGEELWSIDYLIDNNESIYFAIAEVEVPEFYNSFSVPDFIYKNLLYAVPKENDEFSNYRLSDIDYAERKLSLIVKGGY